MVKFQPRLKTLSIRVWKNNVLAGDNLPPHSLTLTSTNYRMIESVKSSRESIPMAISCYVVLISKSGFMPVSCLPGW